MTLLNPEELFDTRTDNYATETDPDQMVFNSVDELVAMAEAGLIDGAISAGTAGDWTCAEAEEITRAWKQQPHRREQLDDCFPSVTENLEKAAD